MMQYLYMNKKYYMFNKPVGCVSARTDEKEKTVIDYFSEVNSGDLSPVGRLDKNTRGLLFVTNDGKWLNYMTDPKNGVEKKYFFWAMGEPVKEKIEEICEGVSLTGMGDKKTKKAVIEIMERKTLQDISHLITGKNSDKLLKNRPTHPVFSGYITVTEGKKHEVRRLLKYAGNTIVYLERIMMGGVELDRNLRPGEYKEIEIGGI